MRRVTPVVVALLLAASVLAAVPAAAMAQEAQTPAAQASDNQSSANATVAPGAQLAGAVGVQGAELDGEVESRTYGIRVAKANSDNARAAVVADQLGSVEQRLGELEQRRMTLQQARENGSMSEGEYRARMAQLHAETRTSQRLANQSSATAQNLPDETLEANGVDASAIRMLMEQARSLTGTEVAEIARGIAGPNAGEPMGPAAGERGPPERGDRGPNNRGMGQAGASDSTETATNEASTDAEASFGTVTDTRPDAADNTTTRNETARGSRGN